MDATLTIAVIGASISVVGWIVNHILSTSAERRRQSLVTQIEFTKQQLEELYGPLAFLVIEGRYSFSEALRTLSAFFSEKIDESEWQDSLQNNEILNQGGSELPESGIDDDKDVLGKTDFDTYPPELAAKYWADKKSGLESGIPTINRKNPDWIARLAEILLIVNLWYLKQKTRMIYGSIGSRMSFFRATKKSNNYWQVKLTLLKMNRYLKAGSNL